MSKKFKIILVIVFVIITVRAVLPLAMKEGINWYLANKVEKYTGHIEDFDLALWRGSYSLEGLHIYQKGKDDSVPPILTAKDLDISIAWRALFKGRLLIDLMAHHLTLNLSDDKDEKKKQLSADKKGAENIFETLIPFRIEKISLTDSNITFSNTSLKVPAKFEFSEINAEVENIHNNFDVKQIVPSSVNARARIQKTGKLALKARFNILKDPYAIDGDAAIESFNLPELNAILLAYGPISFTSGKISAYAEMATKDGKLKAYVKPFVTNIDVVAPKETFKSFKHFGFEIVAAASNLILRSSEDKVVATKIEFDGSLKDPQFSVWDSVWAAIENAFVESLDPKIDGTVQIESVN